MSLLILVSYLRLLFVSRKYLEMRNIKGKFRKKIAIPGLGNSVKNLNFVWKSREIFDRSIWSKKNWVELNALAYSGTDKWTIFERRLSFWNSIRRRHCLLFNALRPRLSFKKYTCKTRCLDCERKMFFIYNII